MSTSNKTTSLLATALLIGAGMLLGGCDLFGGDSPPGPPPATPPTTASKPTKAETKTETKAEEYRRPDVPIGTRRDPFVFAPPKAEVEEENIERQLEPLEGFDINQLKLVAILTGTVVPKAMFVDPTSFGHIAQEEDRIGRNGGRITDIRDNEVEILVSARGGLQAHAPDGDSNNEPVTLIVKLTDTEIPVNEDPNADRGGDEEILEALDGSPGDRRPAGAGGREVQPLVP